MARILITGGAGYIGTVISDLALQQGHSVKVVDLLWFKKDVPSSFTSRPSYKFIEGDIRNTDLLDDVLKDIDFVIHTAAVVGEPASKRFPKLARQINYRASVNLISKAIEYGVKGFIFFSTCSNYGASGDMACEETPLKPLSLYAETKVGVERYLIEKAKGLNWAICRLSTVYGYSPRMRFDLTVNDFTMNAYMKKYLDIFLPHSHRPYIHVFDVAKVVIKILEDFQRAKNNVFNVGFDSENYQKIQISEIVKRYLPKTEIEIVKKGADLRNYRVDFSKLQRFFDIKNVFRVEDGVKEVLKLLKDRIITDPYESCYHNTSPDMEGEGKWLGE